MCVPANGQTGQEEIKRVGRHGWVGSSPTHATTLVAPSGVNNHKPNPSPKQAPPHILHCTTMFVAPSGGNDHIQTPVLKGQPWCVCGLDLYFTSLFCKSKYSKQ